MRRAVDPRVRGGLRPAPLLCAGVLALGAASSSMRGPVTQDDGSSGCVRCHTGIEDMHPEAELSCVDCHGGDATARRKRDAHVQGGGSVADESVAELDEDLAWRRFVNPMDLRVVDRTCAECHPKLVRHLASSLHGTTAGHLSDGFYEMGLLDEKGSAYAVAPITRGDDQSGEVERLVRLPEFVRRSGEQSLATHYPDLVRKECMQCHLYSRGRALRGQLGFDGDYRGEGCAACHVTYASDGLSRSADAEARRTDPGHPRQHTMSRAPATETCTSCHNGDASIGLQFRGLSQLPPRAPGGPDVAGTTNRLRHRAFFLDDPEVVPPDVHHASGMHCVDCHTLSDVMGDGDLHGQMEYAVEISCQTCHGTFEARTTFVTERGKRMRNLFSRDGSVYLRSKVTAEEHRVVQVVDVLDPDSSDHNPRAVPAMTGDHAGVECYTCHSAWNANFLGFHFYRNEALTQLDLVSGRRTAGRVTTQEKVFATWKSFYAGFNEAGRVAPYLTGFSTMGTVDDAEGRRVLDQVMPVTASGLSGMTMVHHQLHTVRPTARACVECHRSPATWGLGSPNFRLARRLAFVADRRGIEVVALARERLGASLPLTKFVLPDVVALALEVDPLQGHARMLYASEGARGIHALDVSDPLHPRRVGFVATPSPRGLALAGDLLYCADGFAGLSIFDVSDPARMRLVGRVPTFDAHEVRIQWPHAYVADGVGGLAIIDVRDPGQPRVVGGIESASAGAEEAPRSGESQVIDLRLLFQNSRPRVKEDGTPADERTTARLLCALLDASHGLILVDVSEARRPEILWPPSFERPRVLRATQSLEYRGLALLSKVDLASPQGGERTWERDYVYLLQEQRQGNGDRRSSLHVLDVSDPTAVQRVSRSRVGNATEMLVPGAFYNPPFLQNVVFAPGEEGVAIADVSTSEAPASLGTLATMRDAYAVVLEEFALDRMLDESGRALKDVSHPGSRWLERTEIDAILGLPGEALGTLGPDRPAHALPALAARLLLAEHDSTGRGWLEADGSGDAPVGKDLDENGIVTLAEIALVELAWRDESVSRAEDVFLRTRVDPDGDLARLLDGVDPLVFDRNDDRELDRREMTAAFFAALDLDADAVLTRDELSRHPGPLRRMRYGRFEGLKRSAWSKVAQGGALGLRDFELRDEEWSALDANGDGIIQLEPRIDPVRRRRGLENLVPEWPTRQPYATGLPPDTTSEALLAAFDRDRDGVLSRRELDARPELFAAMERDGDGRVLLDEVDRVTRRSVAGGVDVAPDSFESRWDLDRSGRVEAHELPLDLAARLARGGP